MTEYEYGVEDERGEVTERGVVEDKYEVREGLLWRLLAEVFKLRGAEKEE